MTNRGFTLLELLVVIGILAVLTIFTVPFLGSSIGRNELKSTTWEMVDALRQAQSKSMAGKSDNVWSVHFESKKFVLFKGAVYNVVDPDNDVHDLPNVLSITAISLNGAGTDMTFDARKGSTSQFGIITMQDDNSQETKIITVTAVGKIDYN